jgi:hypothetical protein
MRLLSQIASYVFISLTLVLAGCTTSGNDVSISDQQKEQAAVASSDHLIVPGQRIGPIRLGMFRDDVLETLGQPNEERTLKYANGREKWTYTRLNLMVYISSGAVPSVDEVTILCWLNGKEGTLTDAEWSDVDLPGTVFQTSEGLQLGTTSLEVRRKFDSYPLRYGTGFIMDYETLGVQFTVTREHKPRVVRISVTPPEQLGRN